MPWRSPIRSSTSARKRPRADRLAVRRRGDRRIGGADRGGFGRADRATPGAVAALGTVADPTAFVAGLTTVTPSPIAALGSVAGPTADVTGLAIIVPAPASALGSVAGPTAGIAAIPLATPAPASALGATGAPLILLGGVAPTTAAEDLAAEHVGGAWLVLVTIDHEDLPAPFRLTSDGVDTISQGYIFSALPFEVVLPDDAEARRRARSSASTTPRWR